MKRFIFVPFLMAVGVALYAAGASMEGQQAQPAQTTQMNAPMTLANLTSSYDNELKMKEKYLAYAQQAKKEGYKKVEQLFRAAAMSKEVHSGLNAKAIAELGATPKQYVSAQITVGTTRENLAEAIKSENEDINTLYPKYLEQAKFENTKMAPIAFGSAIAVGGNMVALFQEPVTMNNLKDWKKASKTGFYVCQVCGNPVALLNFQNCPVCKAPVYKFTQVL